MRLAFVAAVSVAALAAAGPAQAGKRCMVTDPTGTPLNVREASGRIIDTLGNGGFVEILRMGEDAKGKPWAYVAYGDGARGWVYREFISCP